MYGRPPLSEGEATVTLSVKVPAGLKEAIEQNAKAKGISPSAYVRSVLTESLLASV